MVTVEFSVRPHPSRHSNAALCIDPVIEGTALTAIIQRYEEQRGYDPAGAYAGKIWGRVPFSRLRDYYMGVPISRHWRKVGKIAALGCTCGLVECWPLYVRVAATGETVVWSNFEQPQRPGWDYRALGPFDFDYVQYQRALDEAGEALDEQLGGLPAGE